MPAPVRFLPEYDNAVLSHADRSRYTPDDLAALATDGPVHGTALVDGSLAGHVVDGGRGRPRHDDRAPPARRRAADARRVGAEGERAAALPRAGRAAVDVRLVAVG